MKLFCPDKKSVFGLHNEKGFLLVSMLLFMVLLAVTVFTINFYSATQVHMTVNHRMATQTAFDQQAVLQMSLLELSIDPGYRTDGFDDSWEPISLEDVFNGTTYTRKYTRKILNSTLDGYEDVITIEVRPEGGATGLSRSYRE